MSKLKPNAAYFIHGRGRGHASRASVVHQALLTRGYDVTVYAGGDAVGQLRDAAIPFVDRAPLLPSKTAMLELVARTRTDVATFKRSPPQLVVSDGDHAALLAARLCRIPSVAIGHDLTFDSSIDLPNLPQPALTAQRINSLPTRVASRRIAVHFLPVHSRSHSLQVARPDVAAFTSADNNGSILCYFRDHNGTHIAQALSTRGHQVVWFTSQPLVVPGVTVLPPSVRDFQAALSSCKAVVTSAGSNVLAECVGQQKPVLALYRRRDTEQQLNALMIEQANVGVGGTFEQVDAPLSRFLTRVDRGDFARVDIHTRMQPLSNAVGRVLDELQTTTSD